MQRTTTISPYGTSAVSICLSSARVLSFVLSIFSGLWLENASANGNLELASQLSRTHTAFGVLFIILAFQSIWAGRRRLSALFMAEDRWSVRATQHVVCLYLALLLCVAGSAVAVMAGVDGAVAFHAGVGLMIGVVAIFHVIVRLIRKN